MARSPAVASSQPSPAQRICAVVPVYEHHHPLVAVLAALRQEGLDCLLVDDGSASACARALDAMAAADPAVSVLHLPANQGKGAAVAAGFRAAWDRGFTHALQIDADGQHALADIARFVSEARSSPEALVCGRPRFGADAPRSRRYGRRLTQFWVAIHTLSRGVPDAMCGFRVYPLAPVAALIGRAPLGSRMDFDIEILVRLHWLGVPMRSIDTAVRYPAGGSSHFRMWRDNLLITRAHTVLFFGMLRRSPRLLARKLARPRSLHTAA